MKLCGRAQPRSPELSPSGGRSRVLPLSFARSRTHTRRLPSGRLRPVELSFHGARGRATPQARRLLGPFSPSVSPVRPSGPLRRGWQGALPLRCPQQRTPLGAHGPAWPLPATGSEAERKLAPTPQAGVTAGQRAVPQGSPGPVSGCSSCHPPSSPLRSGCLVSPCEPRARRSGQTKPGFGQEPLNVLGGGGGGR